MKTKNWILFFFDLLYMTALGLYIVYQSNADPGDIIFLYVFENMYMLAGLIVFMLTVLPVFRYLRVKHRLARNLPLHSDEKSPFLKYYGALIVLAGIIVVVGGIVVVLLDQIAINFLVEYLGDNGYSFKSIQILSADYLFFEKEVFEPMSRLMNLDHAQLFYIIGGRYFLELIINAASKRTYLEKDSMSLVFFGVINVGAHVVIGPILALLCMIVLVILTAIFGTQQWIIVGAIISFRLLSNLIYWGFSSLVNADQKSGVTKI